MTSAGRIGRLRRTIARRLASVLRRRGRPAYGWTLRLTLAAVASYLAAEATLPGPVPVLAPLTALLVVQLTPVSLLSSGFDRVVSVIAGVGLAVVVSSTLGLSWWSLGLVIVISLLVGQVLRLGDNLLEVPISAMLVLGVGAASAESAAGQRIAETLVGAVVGVLSNLLFPPRVATSDAAAAIERLGGDVARLLREAAQELASDHADGAELVDRAGDWLGQARRLTHGIPNIGAALLRAEESRRLNLRAIGTPDAGPGLRHGLEALEHSAVAVRGMFAAFDVVLRRRVEEGRPVDPDLGAALAVILDEMARGLETFGRIVHQEAESADDPSNAEDFRDALQDLHEARARVTDLLLVGIRDDLSLGELLVPVRGTVERLLRELDLEERQHRLAAQRARPRGPLPELRQMPRRPRRRRLRR